MFPSQIIEPVSDVAEYPSLHETRNCVPVRLGDVGVMLRECSMLNGPLQVLARSRLEIKQIKCAYVDKGAFIIYD